MATGKVRNVPYRIFLTLPVADFPHSVFHIPEFTPTPLDIGGERGNALEREKVRMIILQKRRLTNKFEFCLVVQIFVGVTLLC